VQIVFYPFPPRLLNVTKYPAFHILQNGIPNNTGTTYFISTLTIPTVFTGAAKRRDSTFLPNGGSAPSGGILPRSSSLEHNRYVGGSTADVATGHCAGAETTTTTCSDRERTNSVSSRTSSAAGGHGSGRLRKHSVCSARGGSASDVGKVPWCGCWGNGCI
jgi:hypothetical protein